GPGVRGTVGIARIASNMESHGCSKDLEGRQRRRSKVRMFVRHREKQTKHSEEHGGVLNCELNIGAQYNPQPLGRIVNGLDALAQSCGEPREALDRHCYKERFLVSEMVKRRGGRNPGSSGNFTKADVLAAGLNGGRPSFFQQCSAEIAKVVGTLAGGGGGAGSARGGHQSSPCLIWRRSSNPSRAYM